MIETLSKYIIYQHLFGLSFKVKIEKSEQLKSPNPYPKLPLGLHFGSVVIFLKYILSILNVEIIITIACYFVNNATFLSLDYVYTYTTHFGSLVAVAFFTDNKNDANPFLGLLAKYPCTSYHMFRQLL